MAGKGNILLSREELSARKNLDEVLLQAHLLKRVQFLQKNVSLETSWHRSTSQAF